MSDAWEDEGFGGDDDWEGRESLESDLEDEDEEELEGLDELEVDELEDEDAGEDDDELELGL